MGYLILEADMVFSIDFLARLAFVFVVATIAFQILHKKWKVSLSVALLFVVIASIDKTIEVYFGKTESFIFDILMILACLWGLWRLKKA